MNSWRNQPWNCPNSKHVICRIDFLVHRQILMANRRAKMISDYPRRFVKAKNSNNSSRRDKIKWRLIFFQIWAHYRSAWMTRHKTRCLWMMVVHSAISLRCFKNMILMTQSMILLTKTLKNASIQCWGHSNSTSVYEGTRG